MGRRTKKPVVKPELRRDWLKRNEEDGESPPQIAVKDGYDVRTVRKQIDLAKQEREVREARSIVLRNALEGHYEDLRQFADRLNSHVLELRDAMSLPDDDIMEAALRQHLPRSPIWTYLVKRQSLQQRKEEEQQKLDRAIEELVKADPRLIPLTDVGLNGIVPGITTILTFEVKQWLHGNTEHTLKDSLVIESAGEGFVNPRFGFSHMGVMEERLANLYMPVVHDILGDLESIVRGCKEYSDLKKTIDEISRLVTKLREELAVVRLRRIVPGRCRYCPL